MNIQENVLLSPYTTFHLGGPARFFVCVQTIDEAREALAFAAKRSLPVLILGGGSNMLIGDRGFPGLVIKMECCGIEYVEGEGNTTVIAGAGEEWDPFVAQMVAKGFWGVENLSGIPGTVGAAPVQNIGAYGVEAKETIMWVEAIDRESGDLVRIPNSDCAFGYRSSTFKSKPDRYCIVRVAFSLRTSGTPNLSYKDLREHFTGDATPSLAAIREFLLATRARKLPDIRHEGCAGSFFLNPCVSQERASMLATRYPQLPQYPAPHGVKVSLAWLLDHALDMRGARIGGARLYEQQPLVLVADTSATANDVLALRDVVAKKMRDMFAIEIESEVKIIL